MKSIKRSPKIVIIHNIIAPYKVILFNELAKIIPNLVIIFIAEKERRRDWNIDYSKIHFSYKLLFKRSIEDIGNIKIAKATWKVLRGINPKSIVICDYSNIFGWISLIWGRTYKPRLVFWLDSTKDDRKHYFIKEQIKQFFLKKFELFLSPGSRTKEYLTSMGVDINKIVKIGYAVDNSFYLSKKVRIDKIKVDKEFDKIRTEKNFLYVGRLAEEKNIFTLLEAYKNIAKQDKKWGLMILGDGPQKEQVINYINNNNLSDRIYLFGFIQQHQIVKYYMYSDVFILPSISEPWGLVVNEAMLCGLPIIVSNKCGSAPELVKDGVNGYIFDPFDKKELEDKMISIIKKNNFSDFGKKSLEIIVQHSPKNVANKIYDAFFKRNII